MIVLFFLACVSHYYVLCVSGCVFSRYINRFLFLAHRHRGSSFKNKTRRLVRTNDKESNTQFSTGSAICAVLSLLTLYCIQEFSSLLKWFCRRRGHGVDGWWKWLILIKETGPVIAGKFMKCRQANKSASTCCGKWKMLLI